MEIIAHRGIHNSTVRENSRQAIENVKDSSAQGIEIDVRITSDDICVVHHDTKLSEGSRLSRRTFEQLRMIDPELLSVHDALDLLDGYTGLVNVEVKHLLGERDRFRGIAAVNALSKELSQRVTTRKAPRFLISSYSLPNVKHMKAQWDVIPRAYIVPAGLRLFVGLDRAERYGCDAIHVSVTQMKKRKFGTFVTRAHASKLVVRVFTVNSFHEYDRAVASGVDGIFTDHVEKITKYGAPHYS